MKKSVVGLIIIALLILSGYNFVLINKQMNTVNTETEKSGQPVLPDTPSDCVKTYEEKIECANSNTAYISETDFYKNNEFEKAEYEIVQGKDKTKYSALLTFDNKEYKNNFTLKNEKSENLLTLSAQASGDNENMAVSFLDVNMDGYADIRWMDAEGTMNNSFTLYVWDSSANNFVKVLCDEMLSYFEVHDGYLQNWQKEGPYSGIIQKFVWDKNKLIKVSEEPYQTD